MRSVLILLWLLASFLPFAPAAAEGPELVVTSPSNRATIQGTNVTVSFQTTGFMIMPSSVPIDQAGKHPEANRPGEGHVHLMLDLQPLVVWYKSDPYTFNNVPPGEHELMVELVNNDHSSLTPQVVQIIRFRTEALGGVAARTGPDLTVASPTNGAIIQSTNVTVTFQATGITIVPSSVPIAEAGKHPEANRPGEGHVHLMLDLQPLVVWYKSDPYTFSNIPLGDHQLMVELVNNDHSSLTPPVIQLIRFRTDGAQGGPATNTGPSLTITGPTNGATVRGNRMTLMFRATSFNIVPSSVPLAEAGKHPEANRPGEGHVHLMLDLQPLVVWYKSDPYTFTDLAPGDHQLMVELVNNDHSSLTPPVVQIIRFRVESILPVAGQTQDLDRIYLLFVFGLLLTVAGGLIERHTPSGDERGR